MKKCSHCQNEVISEIKWEKDPEAIFCCHGCKFVYQTFSQSGLNDYYKYKDKNSGKIDLKDIQNQYSFLDNLDYQEEFIKYDDDYYYPQFFIEGVHCLACLWFFEQLPLLNKNIIEANLNLTNSILELKIAKKAKLSDVAHLIAKYGYKVQVLEKNNLKEQQNRERQKDINRIALAFFAMGNIMLLSFSIYSGADNFFTQYFHWLSFLLSLPVMIYSAKPFYTNAYHALRLKSFSIDIPISLALVIGYLAGLVGLIWETDTIYYDSLIMLVFLLLLSRFVLKEIKLNMINKMNNLNFFSNIISLVKKGDEWIEVHARQIEENDLVKVPVGAIIPVDGNVEEGKSYLDTSLISGESRLEKINKGESVQSGSLNKSSDLIIKAHKGFRESLLGKMLDELNKEVGKDNSYANSALLWAKIFLFLSIAISIFIFATIRPVDLAFEKVIAIIIITCPCALGLIVPLTMIIGIGKLKERGIFVKNEAIIEKLALVRNIFLDKTGTLTDKSFSFDFKLVNDSKNDPHDVLYAMESLSDHPIANEYCSQFVAQNELEVKDFYQNTDCISAYINGIEYKIKANRKLEKSAFDLFEDDKLIMSVTIDMRMRKDSKQLVYFLKNHFEVHLLSGDNRKKVEEFARLLGIKKSHVYAELDPIDKKEILAENPSNLMIGDGVNDTLAMKNADVSLAVNTSVDFAQKSADVYLVKDDLLLIIELFYISNRILKTLRRNIFLASMLNSTFIYMAYIGYISPFGAAILMPLSSLVMLVHTLISLNMKDLEKKCKTDYYHVLSSNFRLS